MIVQIEYGDAHLDIEVPDDSVVVSADGAVEPTPLPDPVAATREAITNPLGMAPIPELVGPGSTVTIAIPDRVKGGAHDTAHRKVALPAVLDELDRAGVRTSDIRVVCAIGLHRKNRDQEIAGLVGEATWERLGPAAFVNHDAEDPLGITDLGTSAMGNPVGVNSAVIEADLSILLGHVSGNPYGGYSGGYKMPATGLTTWRSIASHHTPSTMNRADFVPASAHSRFRDQLRAIGKRMEEAMPRPFFEIDAVLDSKNRQLAVAAGHIPQVEQATWDLAAQRTSFGVGPDPFDVLVIGVPRTFHYGNGMGSNPVLMTQAIGASIIRAKAALTRRPFVVAAAVCDGWFNEHEFPSYEEAFELLGTCASPDEMTELQEQIATNPEWVYRYRFAYAYHPFHALSMIFMGGIARQHCSAYYVAGAHKPGIARAMGARTTQTVERALGEIADQLQREPRVLVVPALSKPQFHVELG